MIPYSETPPERFQRQIDEEIEREDRRIAEAIRRARFTECPDPRIQRIIEHCREARLVMETNPDRQSGFGFAYRTFQSILEDCGEKV